MAFCVIVTVMIKDTHFTTNQNDLWHAVKAIKKAITNVSKGPKYSHGITWSEQLADKREPIATHINNGGEFNFLSHSHIRDSFLKIS
jgi:hypothetical protein